MTQRLLLIWRSPAKENRRRFTVGALVHDVDQGFSFTYGYEVNEACKNGFRAFPGFDNLGKKYYSEKLFPNIASRLPNSTRTDYLDILNSYNLKIDSTPFEQLIATKGRLVTDNYEFVPEFDRKKIEFDLAGTKYHQDELEECKLGLAVNKRLLLRRDRNNRYDKDAVEVIFINQGHEYVIGYVPRYYSSNLAKLLEENEPYSAQVSRLYLDSTIPDENIAVRVKLISI